MPFDRTMRISTAEVDAKGTISKRIPENLSTVRKLLEQNRLDWGKFREDGTSENQKEEIKRRMRNRRRKAVTLLEELSLRTSKVIPLMKKLQSICNKMVELKGRLTEKTLRGRELSEDDRQAMTEEYEGLQDLVLEDPEIAGAPLPARSNWSSTNMKMPSGSSPAATCVWSSRLRRSTATAGCRSSTSFRKATPA